MNSRVAGTEKSNTETSSTETSSTEAVPTAADSSKEDILLALRWLAWVLGLTVLWYVLGFASHVARDDLSGAPQGVRLALPLYPVGYGRLFVGALVATTLVGLIGRRPSRVVPAVALAAVTSWLVTRAEIASGPQARLFGNERLILFATILFAVAILLGLALGLWGGRAGWRTLVALSVLAALASGYLLGMAADIESLFTDQATVVSSASSFSRWLGLTLLFAVAVVIAAFGRVVWLLLTAVASVILPVLVTVLGYLSQLIRPGVAGNVAERILAPIADLVPSVLQTASTWWPPLAVLAGGVVGLIVWQVRRGRRADMPVLEPANPVTAGDPGERTPRRGDHDV